MTAPTDLIERLEAASVGEDLAQDAFTRMARAHDRGTGCHLTADMIAALSVTFLGEVWSSPDPRQPVPNVRALTLRASEQSK